MRKAVKCKIYVTLVKLVVVYGSETWTMTEIDMKRLNTWERKTLRRKYGPVLEQGIWRIRSNQKLWDIYKGLDTIADMKKKRLEWIGRVVRLDQGRAVRKIFESKPKVRRRMERLD
jgi:hypothetical protein